MITVTDAAKTKIKKLIQQKGYAGIRIGVRTTGCSGLAYVLEYVHKLEYQPGTVVYGHNDFSLIVDQKHLPYVDGMTVDYVRQGLNEGFEFRNPNERDRCGCGESFRV